MTYKDLIVWQKADAFAHQVYLKTRSFPKDEMFGITSQIRRAALSVPTNIVEGYARKGDKELARFLNNLISLLTETFNLLLGRFEFVYTPKQSSWLNMDEIELQVLSNQ